MREVQPDFSKATGIVRNGWMAVLFAVLAWLVYVSALVCSHGSAFRTAANMKKTLMRRVAYVFQDSRLLKRSIADNLRIAKPDAAENEMMEALQKAQCMDIIERLPEGINTVLGSKGTYLSGGEQQRIAIARAMLKNADVVILDEASAFADPECEAQVQLAFREMARGRTVIMIAHRLSTIRNADRIYVLKDGRVDEQGKHDELLKKNRLYAAMWAEYRKAVNWKVGETA